MKTKSKAKKNNNKQNNNIQRTNHKQNKSERDTVNPNGEILNSMKISKTLVSPYISTRLSLEANRVFGMITCMLVQAKKV